MFVLLAASAGLYLWSKSVPGSIFIPWTIGVLGLLLVVTILAVVACSVAWRGVRHRDWSRPGWFLPASIAFAVVVGLVIVDAPLRIRFALSQDELQAVATRAIESPDESVPIPYGRVGLIDVLLVRVVPEGVLLYDRNGAFFDDAGLAYLPDDLFPPGNGSFESPRFRPLGDHWYAFTASW